MFSFQNVTVSRFLPASSSTFRSISSSCRAPSSKSWFTTCNMFFGKFSVLRIFSNFLAAVPQSGPTASAITQPQLRSNIHRNGDSRCFPNFQSLWIHSIPVRYFYPKKPIVYRRQIYLDKIRVQTVVHYGPGPRQIIINHAVAEVGVRRREHASYLIESVGI